MPVLAATATYGSYYHNQAANTSVSYATVHDAASCSNLYADTPAIGQTYETSLYVIYRSGLFFNTSSIPSDAAVISATLSLYGLTNASSTDFNLTIVNGSALSNPRVVADYGGLLAATTSAGSINSSTWSLTAYNDIALNATGLGFITKAGTTKLALRSSRDISTTTPTNPEWVDAYGVDDIYPAKLTISYEAKGNLFVKAANLHYVDNNGVERYILGTAV